MLNAMMIVPVGNFTPAVARRVRRRALRAATRGAVVISLQSTTQYTWSAVCDFADALRSAAVPYRIGLTRVVPRIRMLLRELGIGAEWFVEDGDVRARVAVLIS